MTIVIEDMPNKDHEGEVNYRAYLEGEEGRMNYGFGITPEEALTNFWNRHVGRLILTNPILFGLVIKTIPERK